MATPRTLEGAFPSRYLTSAEVVGKIFTATVASVEFCVLNKSKASLLTKLAKSNRFDDWVGLSIQISGGMTSLRGEAVPCIVFQPTAQQKAQEVKAELNDDLPDFMNGVGDDSDGL